MQTSIQDVRNNKELIVRKKVSQFIEKIFQYFGYSFTHDTYKSIVYGESSYISEQEEKIKHFYDGYLYLLSNYKNPFSQSVFKRFFYLLYEKEASNDLTIRLTSSYFHNDPKTIEEVIDYHIKVYLDIVEVDENDRLFISLMIFNYCLLKINIPTISFFNQDIKEYILKRDKYIKNDKDDLTTFMINLVLSSKYQDKDFYSNLSLISTYELIRLLKEDEEFLKKNGIIKMYLFGSFIKNIERIDSDIDLLVMMKEELSEIEINNNLDFLKEYYYKKINRFIDFTVISKYLNDKLIKEIQIKEEIF